MKSIAKRTQLRVGLGHGVHTPDLTGIYACRLFHQGMQSVLQGINSQRRMQIMRRTYVHRFHRAGIHQRLSGIKIPHRIPQGFLSRPEPVRVCIRDGAELHGGHLSFQDLFCVLAADFSVVDNAITHLIYFMLPPTFFSASGQTWARQRPDRLFFPPR